MARLTRKQIREGLDQTPMGALIGINPQETKLTHKQKEFARMVALGESKAGAYRKAYNSKGTPKTVATKGWALTQREDIQRTVAQFAEAKQFADSHTAEQLRAFVIQQLTKHASDPEIPPAQRIKALELIGKHHGVDSFITRSEVIHTKSSGDIRARIIDKLKLIGASSTQEAEQTQDNDQDADSLMAELTPSPSEILEPGTHPPGTPLIEPGEYQEPTHIIPHNQSQPKPITHNQSAEYTDSQLDVVDGEWVDSSISAHSSLSDASWDAAETPSEDDLSTMSLETLQVRNGNDNENT